MIVGTGTHHQVQWHLMKLGSKMPPYTLLFITLLFVAVSAYLGSLSEFMDKMLSDPCHHDHELVSEHVFISL